MELPRLLIKSGYRRLVLPSRFAKYIFFCIMVGLWAPMVSFPRSYNLTHIRTYRMNDSLMVEFSCQNLIENEIRKSLLAGLPLIVHLTFHLLDEGKQEVLAKQAVYRVSYDVWEEFFSVQNEKGDSRQFQLLKNLQDWFGKINGIALAPLSRLNPEQEYRIKIDSRVLVLTRQQSQQLKWWMQSGDQLEEDLPSQERSTGFKLNLNRVVQLFIYREENQKEYTTKAFSAPFRLKELPEK